MGLNFCQINISELLHYFKLELSQYTYNTILINHKRRYYMLTSVNTVKQVAEYLQVSEETVRRLTRTGELKKIKLLGKTRITREALMEFINQ